MPDNPEEPSASTTAAADGSQPNRGTPDVGSYIPRDVINITAQEFGTALAAGAVVFSSKFEKLFGVGKDTIDLLDSIGRYGKRFYDPLQQGMGGLQDLANITNRTAKAQYDTLNQIYDNFYENGKNFNDGMADIMVETATATSTKVNALFAYFEDPAEVLKSYGEVFDDMKETQVLRMNELSETERTYLGTFEKGFNVSSNKIAKVMERNIALTGEASVDIFGEISNFSKAVSDQTGVDYKQISAVTMNLITDVQRFGNVQVDEAARIAGALAELGISYTTFGTMVDRFMNFDTAASSLGNLTTLFGVHFDAMEMMMLANEDQEEFLYRIREAFLETGKSVEDMTLAEKKLASQELGMSVQDFENFMNEERSLTETRAATEKASQKGLKEGFETMTQNMVLIQRSAEDMQKYMQGKLMNPLRDSAYETGQELSIASNFLKDIARETKEIADAQIALQGVTEATLGTSVGSRRLSADEFKRVFETQPGKFSDTDRAALTKYSDYLKTNQFTVASYMEQVVKGSQNQNEMLSILGQVQGYSFVKTQSLYKDSIESSQNVAQLEKANTDAQAQNITTTGLNQSNTATVSAASSVTLKQAKIKIAALDAEIAKAAALNQTLKAEQLAAINAQTAYYRAVEDAGGVDAGRTLTINYTDQNGNKVTQYLKDVGIVNLGTAQVAEARVE